MYKHADKQSGFARTPDSTHGNTRHGAGYRPPDGASSPLTALADTGPRLAQLAALQKMADESSRSSVKPEGRMPGAANKTGLPDHLRRGVESLSGMSLENVKVHYNSAKPAQLRAHAYASGTDIYVAPGREAHLPHEAWHVVQQAQGRVKPTVQTQQGVMVNDDRALEHEADVMGNAALAQGRRYRAPGGLATPSGAVTQEVAATGSGVAQLGKEGEDKESEDQPSGGTAGPLNAPFKSVVDPKLRNLYGSMPMFASRDMLGFFKSALNPIAPYLFFYQNWKELNPTVPYMRAFSGLTRTLNRYTDTSPNKVVTPEQKRNANLNLAASVDGTLKKMLLTNLLLNATIANPRLLKYATKANLGLNMAYFFMSKDLQIKHALGQQGFDLPSLRTAKGMLDTDLAKNAAGKGEDE